MALKEIVKVQLALMSNDPKAMTEALVYAINHRHQVQQPIPSDTFKALQKLSQPKAFYWAKWKGQKWEILTPAPSQAW